jgi:sugar lactone lactonase YvrE
VSVVCDHDRGGLLYVARPEVVANIGALTGDGIRPDDAPYTRDGRQGSAQRRGESGQDAEDESAHGLVSVLSPSGALLRDILVPGPDIVALALSPDAAYLYGAENTTNTIFRIIL